MHWRQRRRVLKGKKVPTLHYALDRTEKMTNLRIYLVSLGIYGV